VQWVGSMFNSYGAQLVDAKGEITVRSDATKTVLEWFKKAVPFFPPSVFAWDDASNNKALISGQSALIFNAPSAWAVAKRDAPKVTLYNFPPRGDVVVSVAGHPAPARIGVQIYSQGAMCKMIAQCTQMGKSIDEAIAFGESELEGYMRT